METEGIYILTCSLGPKIYISLEVYTYNQDLLG